MFLIPAILFFLHFSGDEVLAGGKDGFGEGIASFSEHFVGGFFGFWGKMSGKESQSLFAIFLSPPVAAS